MPLINAIEHDDLKKTRRSIYVAAIFTLIVANAEFVNEEASLFGLKFTVSKDELVGLGQLVVLLLLAIFALHSVKVVADRIKDLFVSHNERWRGKSLEEVNRMTYRADMASDGIYDPDDPYPYLEPWEEAHAVEDKKRKRRENAIETFVKGIHSLLAFFFDYALVLATAIVTLIAPELLTTAIHVWIRK